MQITLIISSLSGGGAERVLVLLAEGFLKKGHQVAVVTLYGVEVDFYNLPNAVNRLALNVSKDSPTIIHGLWHNLHRLFRLRQAVKSTQPNVVISFLDTTNVLTLISLMGTKYPVFPTEHCEPNLNYCGKVWDLLRRITYFRAAKVVSVSRGVDNYFNWLPKIKRAVIYNPLIKITDEPNATSLPKGANSEKKWVVAMGRLNYQKGFDLLLYAFKKIAAKFTDWQIIILGEGVCRTHLENLRESLGLTHQVLLPGQIKNPFPILKRSQLFVMSSRFEGFGNVLIEAMACGLPVISTDCPSGPREIISDGIDGILVANEDVSGLAAAMDNLMSNEALRKRLAAQAVKVTERFSLEKVTGIWENVINEVITKK